MATPREWLDNRHPIYVATLPEWQRLERLLEGGKAAIDAELARWEKDDRDFKARAGQAIYVNAMRDTATEFIGHILAAYPEPGSGLSFGSLGSPQRAASRQRPDPAELLWYNTDGGVLGGTAWPEWWAQAGIRAFVVGHRWMLVEGARLPNGRVATQADELAGMHPYMVDYSPTVVTDWHVEDGALQYAIIKRTVRRARVEDGVLKGLQPETEYYLHVRRGWDAFDAPGEAEAFSRGGWWKFNAQKEVTSSGDYDRFDGAVPMFCLFGERSTGTTETPAMSRAALYELGQVQVALMNALSSRQADAYEAAKSIMYLLGVDRDNFNLAAGKLAENSRLIPVPPTMGADGQTAGVPTIHDGSTGAVASEVWDGLIGNILEVLREMAMKLARTAPTSSGVAREVEFGRDYSPRLAHLAANLESAQNEAIRLLELRWGRTRNPSGEVSLPRRYQLAPVVDGIDRMFDTLRRAGLRSKTLETSMVMTAARERQLVTDDDVARAVKSEIAASFDEAGRDLAAEGTLGGDFTAALERQRARLGSPQPPRAGDEGGDAGGGDIAA